MEDYKPKIGDLVTYKSTHGELLYIHYIVSEKESLYISKSLIKGNERLVRYKYPIIMETLVFHIKHGIADCYKIRK